jgi:NDP-sugar pyrophosphorylase family protein
MTESDEKGKEENNEWSAIIPAGGTGSRLRPLTSEIPKPLVPVANMPLIDYAVSHLIYAGIKHIIITLAHKGEKIKRHLEETWTPEKLAGAKIESHIIDSKGNADAFRMLQDHIKTEKVLVSMSDVVTNLPLKKFMKFHSEKGGIATMSMKTVESNISQYGVALLDKDRKIHLFLEKPAPMELYVSSIARKADLFLHTNIINTGIYAFDRRIANILTETEFIDFGGEVFPYLLETGKDLYGFIENYYWMDCGKPQTYRWANWDVLRKYAWPITPKGKEYDETFVVGVINSGDNVIIESPSCFGEYVQLFDDVKVKALTSIGNHVNIHEKSIIEKSILWNYVEVGEGCKIENSIICNDVEIGNGCEIKDSIVAPHCNVSDNSKIKDRSLDLGEEL